MNILLSLKLKIEEYSPKHYSSLLAFPVVLYIVGYFIWSTYLYVLGFSETELLRAEYITSGFSFLIFSITLIILIKFLFECLRTILSIVNSVLLLVSNQIKRLPLIGSTIDAIVTKIVGVISKNISFSQSQYFVLGFATISAWFFLYIIFLFPLIPTFIGGAQPRYVSLLITEESAKVLKTFGVGTPENGPFQTVNLCVIRENSSEIVIALHDRLLLLDKNMYSGTISLPGFNVVGELPCIELVQGNLGVGLLSKYILLNVGMNNLIAGAFGAQKTYFGIK